MSGYIIIIPYLLDPADILGDYYYNNQACCAAHKGIFIRNIALYGVVRQLCLFIQFQTFLAQHFVVFQFVIILPHPTGHLGWKDLHGKMECTWEFIIRVNSTKGDRVFGIIRLVPLFDTIRIIPCCSSSNEYLLLLSFSSTSIRVVQKFFFLWKNRGFEEKLSFQKGKFSGPSAQK